MTQAAPESSTEIGSSPIPQPVDGLLSADQTAQAGASGPPALPSLRWRKLGPRLASVLFPVLVIGLWQAIVKINHISPLLIPAPTAVARRIWDGFQSGPLSFYGDLWISFQEFMLAFIVCALLGSVIGFLLAQWALLETTIYPFLFALKSIPKIAIAPLILLWVNFGVGGMVTIGVVTGFFPMVVNSLTGFKSVDRGEEQMFRGLCASRTKKFFKLTLPSAWPMLFAGFDLCIVYALMGVIIGEFVGGQTGLGVRILTYNAQVDVAGEFAVIVVVSALSVILHVIINSASRRILFWTPSALSRAAN